MDKTKSRVSCLPCEKESMKHQQNIGNEERKAEARQKKRVKGHAKNKKEKHTHIQEKKKRREKAKKEREKSEDKLD